jgi:hypothetical protein
LKARKSPPRRAGGTYRNANSRCTPNGKKQIAVETITIRRGGGLRRNRNVHAIKMIETVPVTVATANSKRGMMPKGPMSPARRGIVSNANPAENKAHNVTIVLSVQATVRASVRRSSVGSCLVILRFFLRCFFFSKVPPDQRENVHSILD